jgi:hypothetical protein
MTHPINYYIQLSDLVSSTIDSLKRHELIELAAEALDEYKEGMSRDDASREVYLNCKFICKLPTQHLITLAHGLLAKAV